METIVLILAYNEEKNIVRAINSVKEQKNVKIVFVDDASTDNTAKIAKWALRRSGIEFKCIRNLKNQGVVNSALLAFSKISNQNNLIIRLDGDDELLPNAIENLKAKYKPGSFVTGPYLDITGNSIKQINPTSIFECLACGVLMHIQDIVKCGGFARRDIGMFIEYDLYARLIKHEIKPIITTGDSIYSYFRHNKSITANKEAVKDSLEKLKTLWGEELVSKIRDY